MPTFVLVLLIMNAVCTGLIALGGMIPPTDGVHKVLFNILMTALFAWAACYVWGHLA